MTPEQREKTISYASRIHRTAMDLGNLPSFRTRNRDQKAWKEFVNYLDSITEPEDGLLEGESIRCNIKRAEINDSKLVDTHFWELGQ